MVGSYSCVHCERTRRSVMEDLPQPPSPQMVIVILWGSDVDAIALADVGRRGRAVMGESVGDVALCVRN